MKDNRPIATIDLGAEVSGNGGEKVSFFMGRSDDCHVVLNDQQVSREHAEITFENNIWKVKQISEYGQLMVNSAFVQEKELATGDMISVGPFLISVILDQVVPAAPAAVEEVEPEETSDEVDTFEEEAPTETVALSEEEAQEEVAEEALDDDGFGDEEAETEENSEEDAFSEDSDDDGFGDDFSSDSGDEDGESSDDEDLFGGDEGEEGSSDEDEYSEDGGYDDDSYDLEALDDDDDVGEKTQVVQSFAKFELELFGESAPYDKYTLENTETLIGRDPAKCQIVLNDPEVSSIHASIKRNNVVCTLEDLQSGNGTILNGERVNKVALTNGDEFIIGSTTFTVKIVSDLISQEEDRLMPVEENQVIEVEEVVEVDADFEGDLEGGDPFAADDEPMPESLVGKAKWKWKRLNKQQKIIYGSVGLLLLFMLLPDPAPKPKPKPKQKKAAAQNKNNKNTFTQEELERIDPVYQLATQLVKTGKFNEAMLNLDEILQITQGREYKNTKQLRELAKNGLKELEEIERKRRIEEERKLRALRVKDLVKKATKATDERRVELAEKLFAEIKALDPENLEVSQLELDLKAWQDEQARKALEEAQKKAERQRKVDALKPGKQEYMKKNWFLAIDKLEKFLQVSDMDADLTEEGTRMLAESKKNLNNMVQPLLGKARSLREGQDLKGAYENYKEILKYEPTNEEALNEMDQIQDRLKNRAKKIYREAIISESLYLFDDAKEKFQEVQQISPSDSDYYKKATAKLKDYLD